MNQIEKTEIIIGLIATIKSNLIGKIFLAKKLNDSNLSLIEDSSKKIKELDTLLKSFYEKLEISDKEYKIILKKIKSYEQSEIIK